MNMHIYTCTYTCTCTYAYTYTCTYTLTYTYTYTYTYAHMRNTHAQYVSAAEVVWGVQIGGRVCVCARACA